MAVAHGPRLLPKGKENVAGLEVVRLDGRLEGNLLAAEAFEGAEAPQRDREASARLEALGHGTEKREAPVEARHVVKQAERRHERVGAVGERLGRAPGDEVAFHQRGVGGEVVSPPRQDPACTVPATVPGACPTAASRCSAASMIK